MKIDTDELNAVLTFKDATTDTKLDNIELPIEFAGVGGKYVTYDRSVFKDNDPSDMYPYLCLMQMVPGLIRKNLLVI